MTLKPGLITDITLKQLNSLRMLVAISILMFLTTVLALLIVYKPPVKVPYGNGMLSTLMLAFVVMILILNHKSDRTLYYARLHVSLEERDTLKELIADLQSKLDAR